MRELLSAVLHQLADRIGPPTCTHVGSAQAIYTLMGLRCDACGHVHLVTPRNCDSEPYDVVDGHIEHRTGEAGR